ncbi:unnamed protein product, partial [Dicrocoelium dendriticum]
TNVLAAGLFGGATQSGARGSGQAATVTQALAGTLPHASAAAMLAATGGQTAGGPNAGPAGDAAATAAAMITAGLMRRSRVAFWLALFPLLAHFAPRLNIESTTS